MAGKKAAIIGGGPTGIAAADFLGRAGIETTIFEREQLLGGVPRHVIPAFRITNEAIEKDIAPDGEVRRGRFAAARPPPPWTS